MKKLIVALVAMVATVGWAGAATAAAQIQEDTDFAGGTLTDTEVVPPGDLILSPSFDHFEDFDGDALPDGWETFNGAPWGGGPATVAGGRLTVDGARASSTAFYDSGRSLDFAATFSADPFQHIGFGVAFEDAPWAMFSTGGGALAVGLYARTLAPGVTPANTPIAVDPLVEHDYSIEWTPTEVRYYVDGELEVTHTIAIEAQMRPVASDLNMGGGSATVEYLDLYSFPESGTFTSRVFDAGDNRATWRTLTPAMDTPAGTDVTFEVRTGTTATPGASWTDWRSVDALGDITGAVEGRYLQYRAMLTTTDTSLTPFVESVSLGYEVDTTPQPGPQPGGGGTGGGGTGGGGTGGGGGQTPSSPTAVSDDAPPTVRVTGRTARVSRTGRVKLRVRCPADEESCRITLRIKRDGQVLARKTLTLEGGERRTFRLRLPRSAFRRLMRMDRLTVRVRVTARDAEGNLSVTSKRMTLLEPRSR